MSEPQRGEIWWIDFGVAGKVRPALVVSAPIADDDYGLIATIPHTTSPHASQFQVSLDATGLKQGFFNVQGLAAVPLAKFQRRITVLSVRQMEAIDAAVKRWLCLKS